MAESEARGKKIPFWPPQLGAGWRSRQHGRSRQSNSRMVATSRVPRPPATADDPLERDASTDSSLSPRLVRPTAGRICSGPPEPVFVRTGPSLRVGRLARPQHPGQWSCNGSAQPSSASRAQGRGGGALAERASSQWTRAGQGPILPQRSVMRFCRACALARLRFAHLRCGVIRSDHEYDCYNPEDP
jgi:hypothetical protein